MKYKLRTVDRDGYKTFYNEKINGVCVYMAKDEEGHIGRVDKHWIYEHRDSIINLGISAGKIYPRNTEDPLISVLKRVAEVYRTLNKNFEFEIRVLPYQSLAEIKSVKTEYAYRIRLNHFYSIYDVNRLYSSLYEACVCFDAVEQTGMVLGIGGKKVYDIVNGLNLDEEDTEEMVEKVRGAYKATVKFKQLLSERVLEVEKVIEKDKHYFVDRYSERLSQAYGDNGLYQLEEKGYFSKEYV